MAEDAGIAFRFLLAVLATWRLTRLITREDGPGEVILRLRRRMGAGVWGQLMDCFFCASLWGGAVLAFFVATRPLEWVVSWLAISGGACLLERWSTPEPARAPPVVIEKLASTEKSHGMLRTEPGSPGAGDKPSADHLPAP